MLKKISFSKNYSFKLDKETFFKTKKINYTPKTKKIMYYNSDLQQYVETEVPIFMNIIKESEHFETQRILAIEHKKKEMEKTVEDKDILLNNICNYYAENDENNKNNKNDTYDDYDSYDIYDNYLENDVYDNYSENDLENDLENDICDVSSLYSNISEMSTEMSTEMSDEISKISSEISKMFV